METLAEKEARRDALNKEWRALDREIEKEKEANELPSLHAQFAGRYFKTPNQLERNLNGEDRDDHTFQFCRVDMAQSIWSCYGFVFHLSDNGEFKAKRDGHISVLSLKEEATEISEEEFLKELRDTLNAVCRYGSKPKQEVAF